MLQSFKLAIKAILSNKVRSLLTMLGIIIGVAAVIILVSIVAGYMGQMVEQFEEMGVNKITINCRNMNTRHFDDKANFIFFIIFPFVFRIALESPRKYFNVRATNESPSGRRLATHCESADTAESFIACNIPTSKAPSVMPKENTE